MAKEEDKEYIIDFADVTLVQAAGSYEEVCKIMNEDCVPGAGWMLRSEVMLSSRVGTAGMILHLYNDGKVYIMEYMPSMADVFYNPDIQCLSIWCQENGWNLPRPSTDLTRSDIPFWKHFWETMLIDSELLDKKFGEREAGYSLETDE